MVFSIPIIFAPGLSVILYGPSPGMMRVSRPLSKSVMHFLSWIDSRPNIAGKSAPQPPAMFAAYVSSCTQSSYAHAIGNIPTVSHGALPSPTPLTLSRLVRAPRCDTCPVASLEVLSNSYRAVFSPIKLILDPGSKRSEGRPPGSLVRCGARLGWDV